MRARELTYATWEQFAAPLEAVFFRHGGRGSSCESSEERGDEKRRTHVDGEERKATWARKVPWEDRSQRAVKAGCQALLGERYEISNGREAGAGAGASDHGTRGGQDRSFIHRDLLVYEVARLTSAGPWLIDDDTE